jgi:hypothetical protein
MGADALSTTARPSAAPAAGARRAALLDRRGLLLAGSLSLGAGLVHLELTSYHWFTYWGYGLFFLLTGIGQVLYAGAVVKWPTAPVLWLGALGNLAIVGMYMLTRTKASRPARAPATSRPSAPVTSSRPPASSSWSACSSRRSGRRRAAAS